MAVTPRILSASTDGRGVTVTGTAATGTVIHTAFSGTGANDFDEIYLWAVNYGTGSIKVTVEWGRSTANAGQKIPFSVAKDDGFYLIVPGLRLRNSRQVRAFAGTASKIDIHGYVNRHKG